MSVFRTNRQRTRCLFAGVAASLLLLAAVPGQAQGVLTVTPGRNVNTSAGNGSFGFSGDGGSGTSATLAMPAAVAYDSAGNLYIADANNHVVRKVTPGGTISTVAGNGGVAGFGGDGGLATAAFLDTPTGVAVDGSGNLYIADSHNHRIRKVIGASITTVAGSGTAGFSGDGASAIAANLNLPSAVAVDAAGNIYIADTNNQRVRKVSNGNITTIAGSGDQFYAGDSASATAASLDSPTGVAVDSTGNVYVADRHNQRIRQITTAGTISTLAGSGTINFSGSFAGDGASATAAGLAKPTGVSVDGAGNVYIADTDNHRIRQVSSGSIATIAGNGTQGFGGDGGPLSGTVLNTPRGVTSDTAGNLAIADTFNQRVRTALQPSLAFATTIVGGTSATQQVTLANTGNASITVSSIAFTGPFTTAAGGTCSTTPITLAAGVSCTQNLAYTPSAIGPASGTVSFNGTGVASQSILLSGVASLASSSITVVSNNAAPLTTTPITFTATVKPAGPPAPTGTVSFYAGITLLGTSNLSGGTATLTTTIATAGTYNIIAIYSGDLNYASSTSPPITQVVADFNFTFAPAPGSTTSQTVLPGQAATYNLIVSALNGPFTLPITFSYSGLPPGATATITPSSTTLGSTPQNVTLVVQTAQTSAMRYLAPTGATAVALLLLPFAGAVRKRHRKLKGITIAGFFLLGLAALTGLTGCGAGKGFFGQQPQTYAITITATATGPGGAVITHSTTVSLTVE